MLRRRYLVVYDISTTTSSGVHRLRKVAQICCGYGVRVQRSTFECDLSDLQRIQMIGKLTQAIDMNSDSLRIYSLRDSEEERVFGVTGRGLDDLIL